ncbi:MAG: chemotaxis-specific protein-glutamate methyltransferase CheB [Proteobacteria bacterium]|nr:MAG: chemotaxis-specific protein-glutamate methyltransferase CheB [Pseudomonadota bacterium]
MLVEDSLVVRECLKHIIGEDPRLEVAFVAASAEEALANLAAVAPDVISLDIRLPGINGLDATLKIMAERPTPIVVIASDVKADDLNVSMNALRAGALAVLEKPVGSSHKDFALIAKRICDQLYSMSSVKVVKQRFARQLDFSSPAAKATMAGFPVKPAPRVWQPDQFLMLGLVASTGGPNALLQVLQALPADFPLPITLVQHITASFLASFGTWLQDLTPFKVVIAKGDEQPKAGTIYMAPEDHHLEVRPGGLRISKAPQVSAQRPSGTILLQSIAQTYGRGAIGAVLTGMGDDGALGLLEMRKAGAYTIGEDESTCVVYGMPAVAARLGGVCDALPLPEIGPAILGKVSKAKEAHA